MQWLNEYELGIAPIDNQHKRIVEFISKLQEAIRMGNSGYAIFVLDGLVDYTLTHFAYEEELQERAGYPFFKAHKRIHAIFVRRIASFRERTQAGEDVSAELLDLLETWLISHIKEDDRDYADAVGKMLASGMAA